MVRDSITKVLIVDDRVENLIALEAILDDDNIEVIKANSGNEALKIMINNNISLVLLDIQMPGMNGFEVAEIMRSSSKTSDIPIIFVTAINKEESYVFKGYELGGVDYIYKPIRSEILKSKVKVFLKLQNQKRIIMQKAEDLERKITELERTKTELKDLNKKLNQMAKHDGLTGIANRLSFDEKIKEEWRKHKYEEKIICLMLVDIDHFKLYNDTYGHLKGDECLRRVAGTLAQLTESNNGYVARYGGEEFAVVFPETPLVDAVEKAEMLRKAIEIACVDESESSLCRRTTISIGICSTVPSADLSLEKFIQTSDNALYKAKKNGRNRVEYIEEI